MNIVTIFAPAFNEANVLNVVVEITEVKTSSKYLGLEEWF